LTKARRRGGGENAISRDLYDASFAAPLFASTAGRRRERTLNVDERGVEALGVLGDAPDLELNALVSNALKADGP